MNELNTINLFCRLDFLLGRWELVIHLQFHTHFVHALRPVWMGIHVMFGGFAGELRANVIQIGKWHSSQDMGLQVVDDAIEDMCGDLDVFAVEASFGIDIDAQLFPVLADDVEDDVVL